MRTLKVRKRHAVPAFAAVAAILVFWAHSSGAEQGPAQGAYSSDCTSVLATDIDDGRSSIRTNVIDGNFTNPCFYEVMEAVIAATNQLAAIQGSHPTDQAVCAKLAADWQEVGENNYHPRWRAISCHKALLIWRMAANGTSIYRCALGVWTYGPDGTPHQVIYEISGSNFDSTIVAEARVTHPMSPVSPGVDGCPAYLAW